MLSSSSAEQRSNLLLTILNLHEALRTGELCEGDLRLVLWDLSENPFHRVPTYSFNMVSTIVGGNVGHIRLRVGSTAHIKLYAGHVGYNVDAPFRGRHYAARSLALLVPLARRVGLDPLWITCDPDNIASRRTLELAGAEFIEVVEVPEDGGIFQAGHPRKCRYRL